MEQTEQQNKSRLHFSCVPGVFQSVVVLLQLLVHIDAGGQQRRQILHGRTSRDLQGPFTQTAHHGERCPAARLHKARSHLQEGAVTTRHRQRKKNVQLGQDCSAELKGDRSQRQVGIIQHKAGEVCQVEGGRSRVIRRRGQDTLMMCISACCIRNHENNS